MEIKTNWRKSPIWSNWFNPPRIVSLYLFHGFEILKKSQRFLDFSRTNSQIPKNYNLKAIKSPTAFGLLFKPFEESLAPHVPELWLVDGGGRFSPGAPSGGRFNQPPQLRSRTKSDRYHWLLSSPNSVHKRTQNRIRSLIRKEKLTKYWRHIQIIIINHSFENLHYK